MLRNSAVISQIRLAAANQRKSREVQLLRKREKIFQKPPKGPVNNRLIQELPEYNDRVSIVGHNRRAGRPKFYTPAKIEKLTENDDLRTREIETLFENEWRDKDPYNYPLFDVRKTPKMLREENYSLFSRNADFSIFCKI
ncbi:unnamed protein product [Oikopleura dioica]|uniref:Uncharacterized protein n=1 Tax=Oikopleura dioica TaxID=34765 RepID=E4Z0J2_OIKDI|nr:unnamed protein product [Oikopleura dioica]